MPTTKKTVHFLSSLLITAAGVAVLGYGMSADWAKTTVECGREESEFNGSATIVWRLFDGFMERVSCPAFEGDLFFQVVPTLSKSSSATAPVALQVVVLFLLALCFLFSAITMLVSLYNSVSNPYETYLGPVGIYVYSSVNACLSILVLIIFALNINLTNMVEELVTISAIGPVNLRDKKVEMMVGYYMVIPYAVLCLVSVGVIYMYHHAAYTHMKEQQKTTEDAPKEIMMY